MIQLRFLVGVGLNLGQHFIQPDRDDRTQVWYPSFGCALHHTPLSSIITFVHTLQTATMSSKPEGAHQALDDDGLIHPGGVDATAGMPTESAEFALTHTSSSVCKKVYVDSAGNDKTTLYVLSICLEHNDQPLFPLNRNHGHPSQETDSAHPRTLILSKKFVVERLYLV